MDNKTAIDDLQFIKRIIADSKTTIIYNGKEYIFWGVIVSIGLLLVYFNFIFSYKINSFYLWVVIIGIGWIYSFLSSRKRKRDYRTITFAGKILGVVWLATGIGMTIIGFLGTVSGAIDRIFVSPLLSVLLGVAFLITGYIHNEGWIKFLSVGWWLGAIYMFFFPGIQTVLIMAAMMTFFQVVPGLYLYNKYKKEMLKL